jgi:hypothetical protein
MVPRSTGGYEKQRKVLASSQKIYGKKMVGKLRILEIFLLSPLEGAW